MLFWLKVLLTGTLIGFLSGLLGLGGSSVSTPILRLVLKIPPLIALATPLPITIPTAVAAVWVSWREKLVDWEVVKFIALGGLPGVTLGALGTRIVSGHWLMLLTALVVGLVGFMVIRVQNLEGRPFLTSGRRAPSRRLTAVILGSGVGLLSGLLANGGGFLLIPGFFYLFGMNMRRATVTSLACVSVFSLPGSLVHFWLGHIDPLLALALGLAVIPSAVLGSRVAGRLTDHRLRWLFGIFLIVLSISFTFAEITGLSG